MRSSPIPHADISLDHPFLPPSRYPDDDREPETELFEQCPIGKVPIMLRSQYCQLHGFGDADLQYLNECPHDAGGYVCAAWREDCS